jgi:hypothetical protein
MAILIFPCCGSSSRFPNMRPKWLLTHPDGKIMLEKAMENINLAYYDKIIITILRKHVEEYEADIILKQIFKDPNIHVLVLDAPTSSPAETIAITLKKMNINENFVVKDCDNVINFNDILPLNFIIGIDIHKHPVIKNLAAKSFISVNEQKMILDIVEKQIVSNIISVGMYGFDSAQNFIETFELLKNNSRAEIYLSHIIAYLVGVNKTIYKLIEATAYEDWGTLDEWKETQKRYSTYIIDLDGVVIKNVGKYGTQCWNTNFEPILSNVSILKQKQASGAALIFMSARSESLRQVIEKNLIAMGFLNFKLILDCYHSPRILINDFAPTNTYPTVIAINIERNDNLEKYL